MGKNRFSGKPR